MNAEFDEIRDLFKWNKTIDLPQQLQWRNADELVLKEWQMKARPYNTKIANGMFAFLFLINLMLAYLTIDLSTPITLLMSAGLFFFLNFVLASVTHQKTKFAYRITKESIEVCEWKEFPKAALVVLKWVAIFSATVLFAIAFIEPKALFAAIIGPGGMGLIYLIMAHSDKFQEMHTQYHHRDFPWSKFNSVSLYKQRLIIDPHFDYFNEHLQAMDKGILFVFCDKQNFSTVTALLKQHLQEAPWIEERLKVY